MRTPHKLTVERDSPEFEKLYPWGALIGRDPHTQEPWVVYAPNSEKQWAYSNMSNIPNVLMEGGRGGGKSTCARGDAHMRCLTHPGFKALILRREMPDLRRTHLLFVGREAKLLGADYNKAEFTVYYPNGSVLVFGHCEDDSAISKYLSSEWDLIFFDELVTFEKKQFLLISACARSAEGADYIALVRGGTNPIGIGADYVHAYFIAKSVTKDEDDKYDPAEWESIKINMDDNPDLNREKYEKRISALKGLSPTMFKAYRYGLWVREGQFFDEWMPTNPDLGNREWHVVSKMPLIKTWVGREQQLVPMHLAGWIQVTRSIDWGYDPDPCVVGWYLCLPRNRMLKFKERVYRKVLAKDVAKDIVKESQGMKIRETIADAQMWAVNPETGHSIADSFEENGVPLVQANKDRINGWMAMHEWLVDEVDEGFGPAPRLQFLAWDPVTGLGCPYSIRTIPTLVHDPKNPGDCLGSEDHAADETRYQCMSWPSSSREQQAPVNPEVAEILAHIRRAEAASESRLGTEATHY